MKNHKAIIIDDEEHCRNSLKKQLSWSIPDLEIVGMASNITDGKKLLESLNPDILFLDIEMPGGSGFDLISSFQKVSFHVIFTTAYDEYAIDAIKLNAVDYLLKPIDGEELVAAYNKIITKQKDESEKQLENLLNHLRKQNKNINKIALPTQEGLEFVAADSIIRCESEGSYSYIYMKNNKKLFLSKTLKNLESIISDDSFIRVHHSHLVNINCIKKYLKGAGGQLVMEDDSIIPVSKSKKSSFLEKF